MSVLGADAVRVLADSRGNALCSPGGMDRPELENRSAAFAHEVFDVCDLVRKQPGGFEPANQLQNAASSAAANYRASSRARSPKEFVAKLGTVSEEADEAVYWLEFIRRTKLAPGVPLERLHKESCELRAIFAASYATARRRHEERQQNRKRGKIKRSPDR